MHSNILKIRVLQEEIVVSYKIEKHVEYAISFFEKRPNQYEKIIEIEKYPKCLITSQHLGQIIRDNNITRKRTTIRIIQNYVMEN